MYRIRPSVAHREISPAGHENNKVSHDATFCNIQSCFLPINPNVHYVPSQLAWDPFHLPQPTHNVDFVRGIQTVGGNGDPTLKEGLAVHVYVTNVSMEKTAFVNNDGDMLILPQLGRLDIQTEIGRMMVRPGELVVIQAGIRFRVSLPDGASRGYIQEVFGAHYELPELGPFGSNGMAYPRDFETPVASFDIDSSEWTITCKLGGKLHSYIQSHTPFDVVAWHGNLAPYKYAIEKFVNMANVEKDQADPTIYCVLTAKSKVPGVSISDFLAFTPRWVTTTATFRPPYYHRNMSAEVMGLIYGQYGGSSHVLEPGGLSYEANYMPHGESYTTWKDATTKDLKHERIAENTMAWMMHISVPLLLTEWAIKDNPSLHPSDSRQWGDVQGHFLEHLDEVNEVLRAANLPPLGPV
jgi:homogentisate 1,2-dioxygenase